MLLQYYGEKPHFSYHWAFLKRERKAIWKIKRCRIRAFCDQTKPDIGEKAVRDIYVKCKKKNEVFPKAGKGDGTKGHPRAGYHIVACI